MRCILSVILLFLSQIIYGQTNSIKGQINHFPIDAIIYAQLENYDGNTYEKQGVFIVDKSGKFEIIFETNEIQPFGRLCFNTGDTISFIEEKNNFEIYSDWKLGKLTNYTFKKSLENEAFEWTKKEMLNFKRKEDSLGFEGISIHEFDPQYTSKSNALKKAYQELKSRHNAMLDSIITTYPLTYCSQSIIPVLKLANTIDLVDASSMYDNNRSFQHNHFFDFIDAQNIYITTHPFLERKIVEYMDLWVSQKDKGLQEGVDIVMKKFSGNDVVTKYVLGALINYFTARNNYPLLDYLNIKHMNTCEAPVLTGKSAEVMAQMKRLSKGNPAPDIFMNSQNGVPFQLSKFIPRKYVVLFFWASWCPHCVEMMPTILNYSQTVKKDGVDFIAISLDNNKDEWLNFIKTNKLNFTNITDLKKWESSVVKDYALKATPTFYVLDASMNIIGRTNELDEVKSLMK